MRRGGTIGGVLIRVMAIETFLIFGNLHMYVRIKLYGRSVKTQVVAIGTTAHDQY
jgi:hypothetical protein